MHTCYATTPTAVIETFISLNHLLIQIKKEAFLSALRLNQAAKLQESDSIMQTKENFQIPY